MKRKNQCVSTGKDTANYRNSGDLTKRRSRKSRSKNFESTRHGVSELLKKYKEKQIRKLLTRYYRCDYKTITDIPELTRNRDRTAIDRILSIAEKRTKKLCCYAGDIGGLIEFNRTEIKRYAACLAQTDYVDRDKKLEAAKKLLGTDIPGATLESQYARTCNASFWRRILMTHVARAQENLFLRLGKIGKTSEQYVSDFGLKGRKTQLRAQKLWIENTVIVPKVNPKSENRITNDSLEIRLSDVVKGPAEKFSKLYSFVSAMETIAVESNLSSAMLTITLEPEWHPNPVYGTKSWNGKSPREGHKSFCKRWQSICRDLHRSGIRISGLRVAEPHADACPHYHTWLLYRPEHEKKILLTVMRYFKLKLKVRSKTEDGQPLNDIVYESRQDFIEGRGIPANYASKGIQVELSRIDRKSSSGASYVMKYIMKNLPTNTSSSTDFREIVDKTTENTLRVDAFRAIWGINQGQLFGLAKCLTAWDMLRKMNIAPVHELLKKLWVMARGGTVEGRIDKLARQPGNAYGFLKALGGLDAARTGKRSGKYIILARLVESGTNKFGDAIKTTTGIRLLEKERKSVQKVCPPFRTIHKVMKTFIVEISAVKTKIDAWCFKTRATGSLVANSNGASASRKNL
jgi:hypothetical protein